MLLIGNQLIFDKIWRMIHNIFVSQIPEQYINDPEFQEYLNREFDKTATHAIMEELAEFAFGTIEAAIKAYETRCKG